ncbi:MAG: hypothetical protein LUC94_04225 [Clostridiales bacterium]|nr:hypothetical protein [Clostridiales bacterium]
MMAIDLHGDISVAYLKKSRFTGSYRGMRYQLERAEIVGKEATETEPEEKTPVIRATIWPEPFNFEVTAEEKKHWKNFPFTLDGIWESVDWLNAEHEAGHY